MPVQITDLRTFINTSRRQDAKSVAVVRVKREHHVTTKFKIRCSRYLYTLVMKDAEKAKKLEASLPPTLNKVVINRSGKK
ncbi:60S ribosomal protein L38, putative [Cryptosporidium muris RN66]|uniref:60S ribosomal protein L38, putative n=1 Tax=Cryptosporidium muris (strain RN66) TaxID=441375 RepID=B6AEX5_CRYMR|nr:60S ribosomal protein L38, putative [Cryptosporidium muris RN66]EEA06742.1 60S ribosomal protein L38, putative [Cryptosporidium muris RN66]|eukprot:XP_002141091.1 60S ribosomal protein L38 [Cryptosporidium muris RN66]